MDKEIVYEVLKMSGPVKVDGNWAGDKWKKIRALNITNYMGSVPAFKPSVQAKMAYDKENLFIIFRVKDQFVRCITKDINGPVWEDSCVEFFFSPDDNFPERYFNLEINCGGTPLMHYNRVPKKEITELAAEDIKMIQIAHTMPQIINPEIKLPVEWTIEYKIPLTMLEKYSRVVRPRSGINWRGNFYKIAENNSNPHYLTWAVVKNDIPDFHLPQFFGILKFT